MLKEALSVDVNDLGSTGRQLKWVSTSSSQQFRVFMHLICMIRPASAWKPDEIAENLH